MPWPVFGFFGVEGGNSLFFMMLVESSNLKGENMNLFLVKNWLINQLNFSFLIFRMSWRYILNFLCIFCPCRMTLLLGPPSSGKTTLLLALSGKLDPTLKVEWKKKILLLLFFDEYSIFRSLISYPIWKLKFLP